MKFQELLDLVGDQPVFRTGFLLAGDVDSAQVQRQLSRWTKSGHLYQLRRGLYALAPPFQKVRPHQFLVANHLVTGSYVSRQSALAYYGLIPERVSVVTSVTMDRPGRWNTPLGAFDFHHLKAELWRGYGLLEVADGQQAFVATPEKALLDLTYLQPGADSPGYLRELRLQGLEGLRPEELRYQADRASQPKLRRVAERVVDLARADALDYELL